MRRALYVTVAVLSCTLLGGIQPGCSCDNSGNGMGDMSAMVDGGLDQSVGDLSTVDISSLDAPLTCFLNGQTCADSSQCCSNDCDPSSKICIPKQCGGSGATCGTAADCCGTQCVSNQCTGTMCVSDGQACTTNGECCSTICSGGTCQPLCPTCTCKTAGNACTMNSDCCSGKCSKGQCASPSTVSFCTQVGDICQVDSECCTGVCNVASGQTVGTCAAITTTCSVDGTLCNGCGSCCSHFCGPFGASGVSVCQPASGCHVQGDLCRTNADCCGGAAGNGLPGAGQVVCVPDPTYPTKIGTCGTPNVTNCPSGSCQKTCDPAGDICHYTQTAVCQGGTTNVRDDCCACISTKDCCKPDATGIPRCNLVGSCVAAGGICSFSGDCCNGLPCVPDSTGTLRCGAMCSPAGGVCTTNSDCCVGLPCYVPPGSLQGTCGGSPPPPDGGTVDMGAPPDMTGVTPTDMAVCAQYGQSCATTPCCFGIPCTNGICFLP